MKMKKCPECKAEIEENARFCLYCMTSFEEKQVAIAPKEKNKLWLYIIAIVLVIALIASGIFIVISKGGSSDKSKDSSKNSSISNDLNDYDNDTVSSEQQKGESEGNEVSAPSNNHQSQDTSKNDDTTNINMNSGSQGGTVSDGLTTGTSSGGLSGSNKPENNNSNSSSSENTPIHKAEEVEYIYRNAKNGDDFSVNADLENAVVITGVKGTSADGKYIIPETIEGKRVMAIMPLAFCDEKISNTVKSVVVPSSVKTIWNDAFANCYNLTDIYFKGNSVYTENLAFAETSKRNGVLTIHCSAGCNDRNYRYYKNSAAYYDAKYEEWNG